MTDQQDPSLFQKGIQFYQEKKYEESSKIFQDLLKDQPSNPGLWVNSSLSLYHSGDKYLALAHSRKAFSLDPGLSTASSTLKFLTGHIQVPDIPHEVLISEQIRTHILSPLTLNPFLFLLALSFLGSGWGGIRLLGERKRAREQEVLNSDLAYPKSKVWTLWILFTGFFIILVGLTIMKYIDMNSTRGTIILEKVEVRSAPEMGAPVIFELRGGGDVLIERMFTEENSPWPPLPNDSNEMSKKNDTGQEKESPPSELQKEGFATKGREGEKKKWYQVTFPGAKSGWIPQESIFITQGGSF